MSFQIPSADSLVTYVKSFTGSTNDEEIRQCILLAEVAMRNIELPALRTNPLTTLGVADANGNVPIPPDMNKPILFYNQGNNGQTSSTGPWIVYDRIGDRDIITQGMIAQLYLQPVNVPAVIRGKFSEVGQEYEFLPYVAEGDLINLYYYKAWPLLFSPADDILIDTSASISDSTGTTATLTVNDTSNLTVGDILTGIDGTGSFGTSHKVTVSDILSSTTLTITGTGITDGTITSVSLTEVTVQSNAVLQTWPEGYVYATLREYYIKRHNVEDAAMYQQKFDNAWSVVEDQNNLGKWSGGHTRLTSVWQPRQYRQYNIK